MSGIDWEKSKATNPLKNDLLRAFFRVDRNFYLTGGSALGLFYLGHRKSLESEDKGRNNRKTWNSLI